MDLDDILVICGVCLCVYMCVVCLFVYICVLFTSVCMYKCIGMHAGYRLISSDLLNQSLVLLLDLGTLVEDFEYLGC